MTADMHKIESRYDVSFEGNTCNLSPVKLMFGHTNPLSMDKDELDSFVIYDVITLDSYLYNLDCSLGSLLNTPFTDETELKTKCDAVGVVLSTYSEAAPNIDAVPETSDGDGGDDMTFAIIGVVVFVAIALHFIKRR